METLITDVTEQLKAEGFDPPGWRQVRARAILAKWPVNAQMEAYFDASIGKPERLTQMQADIAAIKLLVDKE